MAAEVSGPLHFSAGALVPWGARAALPLLSMAVELGREAAAGRDAGVPRPPVLGTPLPPAPLSPLHLLTLLRHSYIHTCLSRPHWLHDFVVNAV